MDISSGLGINNERANTVQTKCTFCGGANHSTEKCFKSIRKEKEKLARLVIRTTDEHNVRLTNVLDVDLKIT